MILPVFKSYHYYEKSFDGFLKYVIVYTEVGFFLILLTHFISIE